MSNKKHKNDKAFSSAEVGTLVESLRADFRAVTEVVAPLPGRLTAVEEKLSAVEDRLIRVEDVVRVAILSLSTRVSTLETKVGI
jgi:hypothetical protein